MKFRKRQYSSIKKTRFGRFWPIWLVVLILLAVGLGLALRGDNASNQTGTSTSKPTSSKGEAVQPSTTPDGQKLPGSSTTPSGEAPKAPYGNFVSSHTIGQNDPEASTCLTSPGAKCKISFSKDGITKTLDEKTVDADGAAYWTWTPKALGLSPGEWQITATATLNSKISSTTDSRNLTVQP